MDFYESIADYYLHIFPLSQEQITFIQNSFDSTNNLIIMDVGCGIGSLSMALSKSFKGVIGTDLDKGMLEKAMDTLGELNNVQFQQLDMLNTASSFGAESLDAIVCFGNTLVHLENESAISEFFNQAFKVLKKGGKFLLQIVNYDRIIDQKITNLPTLNNEVITFERNYIYHKEKHTIDFITKLTIKKSKNKICNTITLVPVKQHTIALLLKQAGFKNIHYFGNFKRDPYIKNSMALIVEAAK